MTPPLQNSEWLDRILRLPFIKGKIHRLGQSTEQHDLYLPNPPEHYYELQKQAILAKFREAYMQGVEDELECVRSGGHDDLVSATNTEGSVHYQKLNSPQAKEEVS